MKTKTAEKANPQTTRNVAGVATNHSSVVPSTNTSLPDNHAQFDDEMDNVQYLQDPNLSGTTETAPLHDPIAGPMSGWEENDCYRDFFLKEEVAVSRIYGQDNDPDYDSNGGMPSKDGLHDYTGQRSVTSIGPVVTRRI
jgi:hypothetical protein